MKHCLGLTCQPRPRIRVVTRGFKFQLNAASVVQMRGACVTTFLADDAAHARTHRFHFVDGSMLASRSGLRARGGVATSEIVPVPAHANTNPTRRRDCNDFAFAHLPTLCVHVCPKFTTAAALPSMRLNARSRQFSRCLSQLRFPFLNRIGP